MVYIETSTKSVQQLVDEITDLVSEYKFGVLHVHNVKETLNSKDFEFENECRIMDICNPRIAQAVLNEDMTIASILPCKVSVYEENGESKIAMNSVVQLFDDLNPDLIEYAQEAQDVLLEVIQKVK